jgi:beta-glucosidase
VFVADDIAEVHVTTTHQESPRGNVVVAADPGGSRVVWSGEQNGVFTISGRASDMRAQAARGVTLDLRYRVDRAPTARVDIGLRCTEPLCGTRGGAILDVTPAFKKARPGNWRTLSIPLSCFTATGADLGSVVVPFALETSGRFGLTISEVRLAQKAASAPRECPGTI